MDSSSVWDGQDPTLSVPSQDDFNQFLNINMNNLSDTLQFEFQDFSGHQAQGLPQMMPQGESDAMDHSGLEGGNGGMGHDTTMQEHMPPITTAASHPAILGTSLGHDPSSEESLVELDAQIQYLQHQRQRKQQRQLQEQQHNFYAQNGGIPPTPNSMELHPGSSQFYPHTDPAHQAVYERFQMQMKEQEMAFTPLVSPAVTPLEAHFNIPEYTVPGAYLSPISSPALHAQNEQQSAVFDQRHPSTRNSPADMNVDSVSLPTRSGTLSKKNGKKPPTKPRATRAMRQSPIVKPKRPRKGSVAPQALGDIIEPSPSQTTADPKQLSSSRSAPSTEESENGSISPEHLSDMGPPPVPTPGSATRSPFIPAQKENTRNLRASLGSPATPASLMRLPQSPQVSEPQINVAVDGDDQGMDGFFLPEAASSTKPPLPRLDTHSDGQTTPTLSSTGARTPATTTSIAPQPLPSPALTRPRTAVSASQSPQIDSMNGSSMNGTIRKASQAAGRSAKKRSSSSVLASPALLPRISPSIKPLMPGTGTVSEDTASLLLASKSNYQNILEGNHLPGVSYPSELSTNLTSKRTSHKIAEQGRRNRINSALQEIATLLPRSTKDSSGEKSGSGDAGETNEAESNAKTGAQSANSKASTVELAIEYIHQLKKDLADATRRAEEAENQLNGANQANA